MPAAKKHRIRTQLRKAIFFKKNFDEFFLFKPKLEAITHQKMEYLSFFSCWDINTSRHQHINTSSINTSTHQHINTSTHQHSHQHTNTSTHQHIKHIKHINTSAHQHSHQHMTRWKKKGINEYFGKKKGINAHAVEKKKGDKWHAVEKKKRG